MIKGMETKSVKVGQHDIVYSHRQSDGPTLVFVHGITTYRFIWRNLIPFFPENYNIIALDLLGCGDSAKPLDASFSIKAHAHRLREFFDNLGIEKLHLTGHDVGGGVVQIFAVHHPEMLQTLTLINSVGYDFWPVQPIIAMRTPIIRQMAMATLDLGMLRAIVARGIHHQEKLTVELMAHFSQPMSTSVGRKAFLHFAKCLNNKDLLEIESDIKQMKIPTLIIRGAKDPYLSEKIAHRLHLDISGSDLVILEKGSHFIQEDLPQELAGLITAKIQIV